MTGFTLKIIALITMVLDHIRYAVPMTDCFVTEYFGRLTFPIFAFLITEGAVHTSNRKKYFLRMLLFACISQIPFMMFRTLVANKFLLNIMFTFLFGIMAIYFIDYCKEHTEIPGVIRYIMLFIVLSTLMIVGMIIPVDYGWFGVATVIFFYVFRESKILKTLFYISLVIAYYFCFYVQNGQIDILKPIFTILPCFLILLYNGKEGKKLKYFFYLFYPIHMLIIYGLSIYFK